MRGRCCARRAMPRFCWSALPRMLMNTAAVFKSPDTSTSLTVTTPASLTGNSWRIASPMARFNNSRTRWSLREGIRNLRFLIYDLRLPIRNRKPSQFLCDLFDGITFDGVANLEFAEALDADAAFHAGAHFVDFILEPAQ